MDTGESNESTTPTTQKSIERPTIVGRLDVIRHGVYSDLELLFDREEGTPENLLVDSAKRLTAVAHNLLPSPEEKNPVISAVDVDNIVRLSMEARACLKDALEVKKAKVVAAKILIQASRGK